MTFSFHASSAYLGVFATSITPTMPTFSVGDLLIAHVALHATNTAISTPSGWTLLSPNANQQESVFYGRIAQSGDTAPTFTWSGSNACYASMASFSGAPGTITVLASGDSQNTNTGNVTVPALTGATTGCLVLRCVQDYSSTSGGSWGDWVHNNGVFTKAVQKTVGGSSQPAVAWWYWIQTTATNPSSDNATISPASPSDAVQGGTVIVSAAGAGSSLSLSSISYTYSLNNVSTLTSTSVVVALALPYGYTLQPSYASFGPSLAVSAIGYGYALKTVQMIGPAGNPLGGIAPPINLTIKHTLSIGQRKANYLIAANESVLKGMSDSELSGLTQDGSLPTGGSSAG